MPASKEPPQIARIRRAAKIVELRVRASRALAVLPSALTGALAFVAVVVVVRKTLPERLGDHGAFELFAAAGGVALCVVLGAALRRLPKSAGAVALDAYHGLADRLTNALAFSAVPAEKRTPLMDVAIDDACDHAGLLKPSGAAPLRFPKDLGGTALVAAGVFAVALFKVPVPLPAPVAVQTIDAVTLSPDDVELFRDAAKALKHADQSPEMKAAVEKFNQLIEDIDKKRVDRVEAFRRMEAIERELVSKQDADRKAFDEALKETADELKKSDASKPLAESLEKKDFEQAKKDLKAMAEALKKQQKKPDKAALEKLRQALKKASERKKEALAAINEKRAQLKEELLKKKSKKDDPDAGPKDQKKEELLKKKERELERLDREAEQRERSQKQLERLDRDLAKAAEDLMRDLGMSAEDLDQAAEDINRMQNEQMTDKEKEELKQRLEELRDLLRQKGGKERMSRLMKFGKRARGGTGQKGEKGGKPSGGPQGDDEGDENDSEDGQDGKAGEEGKSGEDGKSGDGKGGQGGKRLVLGRGGKTILMPGGSGPGSGQGSDSPGGSPGGGAEGHGKEAGTGHDANLTGKATDLKGDTVDSQQEGLDTKQGPSNSKVIYGAAEKGFKGGGYKKVFTDYHTVAEQQLNKDQVPDGYRSYVHRYFELIRPRE